MRDVTTKAREIVLASSSSYRKALIGRLGLACDSISPEIDEKSLANELPEHTALRLAVAKARKVAALKPDALIIGSDQVALMEGAILHKPGTHDVAVQQLRAMSGRSIVFHTAVCLLDARSGTAESTVVPTRLQMRALDDAAIERYLRRDQPYDCAGSAKIESLGIALVEKVESDDPTALIGLPLIALVSMLQRAGVQIP